MPEGVITIIYENGDVASFADAYMTCAGNYLILHEQLQDAERISYLRADTVKKATTYITEHDEPV